nr:hypothetical protein [Tanacetum cinerariifolium]
MMLTFAETHNMVIYLSKSDANEWFNQITDFLNGSSLKYALTVNPNIYVSCIKQFWTTVAVKKVNDVIRLQALVDKKKVVVTEAKIREALHLDDAEGVKCLPNEEVFAELARMGYEKPSTKLTFYKSFFSIQWKFLIHTILQCMSTKRTSWNEFSSSMASAVICLSSGDLSTHTTKYTSPALTHKVLANMRRVGKGFSRVEKPLFEGMLVAHEVGEGVPDEVHDKGVPAVGIVANGDVSAANEEPSIPSPTPPTLPPQLSQDIPLTSQIAQALEITKLKQRVKKLERRNKGRMIAEMDQDADNVAGFKMDYFKGMSYDNIRSIFKTKFNTNMAFIHKKKEQIDEEESIALKRINETPTGKAAKRQKLDEEVEELKRHLQIVPYEEDDVYTEATPLARKPNIHAQIWKNQRSVYGPAKVKSWKLLESCGVQIIVLTTTQLILLVERKYPLTKFTMDQMLNAIRLEVEEESKVSLELLRLKEKHAKCLMLLVEDLVLSSQDDVAD